MNCKIFYLILLIIFSNFGFSIVIPFQIHSNIKDRFNQWKTKFQKNYLDEEQSYRLMVFKETEKQIQLHNKQYFQGKYTFTLGHNQFSDITVQEYNFLHTTNVNISTSCPTVTPTNTFPESWDWQTKGAVTKIKNEGSCLAYWAFAPIASIESLKILQTGDLSFYSEQQIIDCSSSNTGCKSGTIDNTLKYLISNGLTTQKIYPYKGSAQNCTYDPSKKSWSISSCSSIKDISETTMKAAVYNRPIIVMLNSDGNKFKQYKDGVYSVPTISITGYCKKTQSSLNNAMLLVGYGTSNNTNYWKIKHSIGSSWGLQGYMYIKRQSKGSGTCGIQTIGIYPNL